MSLETIITNVAALLATVTGIGKVHGYERWAADEAAFKTLFVDSGKVCGWTITRESGSSVDYVGRSSLDAHTLVMRGYYSLNDSANTEKTFQDLIEAIRAKFQNNRRLSSGTPAVIAAHDSDRIAVRIVDHRMFAGILCHYAELVLVAREFVQ
jgi:hypothetical protein